jgi:hypothetical protein
MNYDVVTVRAIQPLRLVVRFADGLEGEVRFEPSHLFGVFEALKNPTTFDQVTCEEGFVAWPGDIDLAPDAMYEAIKREGVWILR